MIIGGVEITKTSKYKKDWRYTWKGKTYGIAELGVVANMSIRSIYRCVRHTTACFVGRLSDGTEIPMLTKCLAQKYGPKGLEKRLVVIRLTRGDILDAPITKEEKKTMEIWSIIDVPSGQSPTNILRQYENMQMHRMIRRWPRPKGMIDEAKEWQQPAW